MIFTSLGDSSIKCSDTWHAMIAGQNIKLLQFYQWKALWEIKISFSACNLKNITAVFLIGETVLKEDGFPLLYCSPPLSLFFSPPKSSKWAAVSGGGTELMAVSGLATLWLPLIKCFETNVTQYHHDISWGALGIMGMRSLGGSKCPNFCAFWYQDIL